MKVGEIILISDTADFTASKIIGDKEHHYLMIKRSILHEDIITLYTYAPKNSVKIHEAKMIELQRQIYESTITYRDVNTHLSKI